MQKLIIQDIPQITTEWYAIRFGGLEQQLHAMNVFLTQQLKEKACWEEAGFLISICSNDWQSALRIMERAIVIAERGAALKQINMLATQRRTKRR